MVFSNVRPYIVDDLREVSNAVMRKAILKRWDVAGT